MKDNFYERMTAFQKKKCKTVEDYINYIKAITYVAIFEYDDDCSCATLNGLNKSDVEVIADHFTKLGFRCTYILDDDDYWLDNDYISDDDYILDNDHNSNNGYDFYFYLYWQKEE